MFRRAHGEDEAAERVERVSREGRAFGSREFRIALAMVFCAVLALWGYGAYLERFAPDDDGSYIVRDVPITPEIELLQRYVQIDTSHGNETDGARFLADVLARHGIASEIIESAPGRGNLYARLRGKRPGEGLMLLHHIDVMPASSERWSHPPFSGTIERGVMHGRGTLDMKGIGITHLSAFIEVARSGRQPERDLVFLATADEENRSQFGMEWLIENRPDIFDGVRYALNEGGVTETIRSKVTFFGIEIGSKQAVVLDLYAQRREDLERLRIELQPFREPAEAERIHPGVKAHLAAIAPTRIDVRELLVDIDATIEQGRFWRLDRSYRRLAQNNLYFGPIRADGDGFKAIVSLQNLPHVNPDDRIDWLREFVAPRAITLGELWRMGPTGVASHTGRFYEMIVEGVKRHYGNELAVGPLVLSGTTNDSRYLRAIGIEAYGVWPFPVDFHQTRGIHGAGENVRLDWFAQGVNLMREIVREHASGDEN